MENEDIIEEGIIIAKGEDITIHSWIEKKQMYVLNLFKLLLKVL
jgi:hypothetical protein